MAAAPSSRRAALMLAAVALSCAALFNKVNAVPPIRALVLDCQGIKDSFALLNQLYNTTTSTSPITLDMTLACNGNFTCQDDVMGSFVATNAPTKNGKQPKVRINIASDPKCRKAGRPTIDTTDPSTPGDLCLVKVDSRNFPKTTVDVTVTSVDMKGRDGQLLMCLIAYYDTNSRFKMTDSNGDRVSAYVSNVATVAITGGTWIKESLYPSLDLWNITKSASIKNGMFEEFDVPGNNESSVAVRNTFPRAKVTISNSKFSTNRTDDGATSVTLAYLNDVGGARLTRNQFMNAQAGQNMTAVCIRSLSVTARQIIALSGDKGVSPMKKPWPVTETCNIAWLKKVPMF